MTEVLTLIVLLAIAVKLFWPQLSHGVTWIRLWCIGNLSGIGGALDKRGPLWLAVGVLVGVVLTVGMQRLPVRIDWPEWVPNIPVITVESGPRNILIVRESTPDQNTQLDSTLTQLQNGAASPSVQAKGHAVLVLDPDAKNSSGQPTPALKSWFEKFPSRQHPVMIISDKAGKVLYAEPLSESAKLTDIVAIVEAND